MNFYGHYQGRKGSSELQGDVFQSIQSPGMSREMISVSNLASPSDAKTIRVTSPTIDSQGITAQAQRVSIAFQLAGVITEGSSLGNFSSVDHDKHSFIDLMAVPGDKIRPQIAAIIVALSSDLRDVLYISVQRRKNEEMYLGLVFDVHDEQVLVQKQQQILRILQALGIFDQYIEQRIIRPRQYASL